MVEMMDMKTLLACIAALILLYGCTGSPPTQVTKEEIAKELNATNPVAAAPGLISASGDEKSSVVTIRAENANGTWHFPLADYPSEFEASGLYSDSFIRLNSTYVKMLGQGESIWLTPMIRGANQTVLFNAIYTNEPACNAMDVRILGKEYAVSQLKNGSRFENDDKWKVSVERDGGCLKRIVIFLDGYYSDLKDGDQIPLFRSDNTVLFAFERGNGSPQAKIIATSPAQTSGTGAGSTAGANSYILSGGGLGGGMDSDGLVCREREGIGDGGINLIFEPAIPMFRSYWEGGSDYVFDNLLENTPSYVYVAQFPWDIARLRASGTFIGMERRSGDGEYGEWNATVGQDEFIIGKARPLLVDQCENISIGNGTYSVRIDAGKILLKENDGNCTTWYSVPFDDDEGIAISENDSLRQVNGKWVQLQMAVPIDAAWAQINVFDSVVNLTGDDSVSLTWETGQANATKYACDAIACRMYNVTFPNPALKSAFIPRASPIFEKLTG